MKAQYFYTKLPCQKPMLNKLNAEYKMNLSQRMQFATDITSFFKNLIWV